MPKRRILAAAALAAAALLAGCGSGVSAPAGGEAPVPGSRQAETARPLDFTATTLAGSRFDAASLQGKHAILWFWAPF